MKSECCVAKNVLSRNTRGAAAVGSSRLIPIHVACNDFQLSCAVAVFDPVHRRGSSSPCGSRECFPRTSVLLLVRSLRIFGGAPQSLMESGMCLGSWLCASSGVYVASWGCVAVWGLLLCTRATCVGVYMISVEFRGWPQAWPASSSGCKTFFQKTWL